MNFLMQYFECILAHLHAYYAVTMFVRVIGIYDVSVMYVVGKMKEDCTRILSSLACLQKKMRRPWGLLVWPFPMRMDAKFYFESPLATSREN